MASGAEVPTTFAPTPRPAKQEGQPLLTPQAQNSSTASSLESYLPGSLAENHSCRFNLRVRNRTAQVKFWFLSLTLGKLLHWSLPQDLYLEDERNNIKFICLIMKIL